MHHWAFTCLTSRWVLVVHLLEEMSSTSPLHLQPKRWEDIWIFIPSEEPPGGTGVSGVLLFLVTCRSLNFGRWVRGLAPGPLAHTYTVRCLCLWRNRWTCGRGCVRKRKEQEPSCPLVIKEAASVKTSQLNVLINCVLFWMVHYKYLVQLGHISYTKTLLNLWPQLNVFSLHLFGY